MGCAIDSVVQVNDSVIVWAEGEYITYILVNGEPKHTASSKNYFRLFRFRPLCKLEHEEVALEALLGAVGGAPKVKIKKKRGKKKKEEFDAHQLFKNPYPVNPARFPIGENGEYAGHHAAHIANYVSVLFRNEKRNGVAKPDFKEIADRAFKELGFVGKNLGAVYSVLSKEIWRRRKAKAAAIFQRKVEEAREAERNHLLPLEV